MMQQVVYEALHERMFEQAQICYWLGSLALAFDIFGTIHKITLAGAVSSRFVTSLLRK